MIIAQIGFIAIELRCESTRLAGVRSRHPIPHDGRCLCVA